MLTRRRATVHIQIIKQTRRIDQVKFADLQTVCNQVTKWGGNGLNAVMSIGSIHFFQADGIGIQCDKAADPPSSHRTRKIGFAANVRQRLPGC